MKENMYRDIYCGEVDSSYIGKELKLAGWVNSIRNLGNLIFVTLRDETGIVQLISEDGELFKDVHREATITITGLVEARTPDMVNKNMKTGEVEVRVKTLEVLGDCTNVLPFEINKSKESNEDTRLKYRYLDLRNKEVHDNIIFRSKIMDFLRKTMKEMDFLEVQTPIITATSPEGARDFIIPSRKFAGKFYALPQSPQIFKQLLMVSGFNKYFQIAPCFRDEDCRADRTLEFYQLDFEMSFATEEDVYKAGERIFYDIFTNFSDKEVSKTPFKRIPYREAMLKYGSDKPDLRNPLIIEDLTDILSLADFAPFKDTTIRAIKVSSIDKSNSWFKQMEEYTKTLGGTLGYIKVNEDMTFKSSLDKFLNDDIRNKLKDRLSLTSGNIIFIVANQNKEKCAKILGQLRIKLGNELDLLKKNCYEFCIINDFPMYEYNEETNTWDFGHNPFSMPKGGMESLKNSNIEDILAYQYDFVCNGCEMSSGAVRNHSISIMKKAFELAGYDEETIKNKFRSLYTAFQYGAPPHAGMAPGIDRIIMLLTGEENLREVQVFPPNVSGQDTLMGGPNELTEQQLRELHIKIRD